MTAKKPKPPHVWVAEVFNAGTGCWQTTLFVGMTQKALRKAIANRIAKFTVRIRKYVRAEK